MSSTSTAPQDTTISSKPQQTQPGVLQSEQNAASNAGTSGVNTNDIVSTDREDADRGLAGRTRAGSAGSKRSRNAGTMSGEKGTRPASTGAQNQATTPRAKKKSGFLSFLNCCGAPDQENELGMNEAPQPAKQVSTTQPTRTQPPAAQIAAQKASTPAQNAESGLPQASDEKASGSLLTKDQPSRVGTSIDEKDARTGNVVPEPTSTDTPIVSSTSPTTNEESSREKSQAPHLPPIATGAAIGVAGGLGVGAVAEYAMESNPNVTVQAPTPIAPTPISQPEHQIAPAVADPDELISDRTSEQKARDTDIEMTDNGPSLPLSSNDVNIQPSDEHETVSKRESVINLPPPPPLEERQAQMAVPTGMTPTSEISRQPSPVESQRGLLPVIRPEHKGRKCLILDLDETLVHSSFKILHQADFTIPVEIEGQYHNVYVIKRPGVDAFMKRVGELYEVVVFTASVSKYGDPLLDQLDIHNVVHHRLFRESCYNHQGNYVKDLSQVGRDLKDTIIIDNSPTSYIFHPQHAVPISSWFSDAHDNELLDLIPVLEDLAGPQVSDVSLVLDVAL
ncbi:hypothetical protein MBLNU457_6465t1 [Dothideomycetes sp. NU457]